MELPEYGVPIFTSTVSHQEPLSLQEQLDRYKAALVDAGKSQQEATRCFLDYIQDLKGRYEVEKAQYEAEKADLEQRMNTAKRNATTQHKINNRRKRQIQEKYAHIEMLNKEIREKNRYIYERDQGILILQRILTQKDAFIAMLNQELQGKDRCIYGLHQERLILQQILTQKEQELFAQQGYSQKLEEERLQEVRSLKETIENLSRQLQRLQEENRNTAGENDELKALQDALKQAAREGACLSQHIPQIELTLDDCSSAASSFSSISSSSISSSSSSSSCDTISIRSDAAKEVINIEKDECSQEASSVGPQDSVAVTSFIGEDSQSQVAKKDECSQATSSVGPPESVSTTKETAPSKKHKKKKKAPIKNDDDKFLDSLEVWTKQKHEEVLQEFTKKWMDATWAEINKIFPAHLGCCDTGIVIEALEAVVDKRRQTCDKPNPNGFDTSKHFFESMMSLFKRPLTADEFGQIFVRMAGICRMERKVPNLNWLLDLSVKYMSDSEEIPYNLSLGWLALFETCVETGRIHVWDALKFPDAFNEKAISNWRCFVPVPDIMKLKKAS